MRQRLMQVEKERDALLTQVPKPTTHHAHHHETPSSVCVHQSFFSTWHLGAYRSFRRIALLREFCTKLLSQNVFSPYVVTFLYTQLLWQTH